VDSRCVLDLMTILEIELWQSSMYKKCILGINILYCVFDASLILHLIALSRVSVSCCS
jgi:hypothetical protein